MTTHKNKAWGFQTKALHLGQEPDSVTGSVVPPIYQSTAFVQLDGQSPTDGYTYSRFANPTRTALETALAGLEGGTKAFSFASGMGAISLAVLALLEAGDHIVVGDDVYGGTYNFFADIVGRYGVEVTFVDMADLNAVEEVLTDRTKMVFIETPTNPLLKMADLKEIIRLAHAHDIIAAVDNTFASPYLQNPFKYGADIIIHSTTKYISGHSDVLGGAIIVRDDRFVDALNMHKNAMGATLDAFAAWLTLRGLKTLGIRMIEHCKNAMAVAAFLEGNKAVEKVIYPGLPSYPQYELAQNQMKGPGGMVSFYLKQGTDAQHFVKSLSLFKPAVSLGGVESLVTRPVDITHASIPKDRREAKGITDNFIRFSVGIEDIDDLLSDIDAAMGLAERKT